MDMTSINRLFRIMAGGGGMPGRAGGPSSPLAAVPHPTCLLVVLLLAQGCEQPFENEFVGRIRFIRSVPSEDGALPSELVHGVITVYTPPRFTPIGLDDHVVLSVDGGPCADAVHPTTLLKGTVRDVLEQLAAKGLYDAVARIDGCDWMLTRGPRAGTIEVLRDLRRIAMLRIPNPGSPPEQPQAISAGSH